MMDICNGLENFPVYYEPEHDHQEVPEFQYIRSSIPGCGCNMDDFEIYSEGCKCEDKICGSDCDCALPFGHAYDDEGKIVSGFLTESNIPPIFECNRSCVCHVSCRNRVIQKGIKFSFSVYRDEHKGHCLKSTGVIPKYSFVCEYAGEVISLDEARRRTSLQTKDMMNYIIVLREHVKDNEIKTTIDPVHFGNIGRFINHSCDPNLAMVPIRVENRVPKLCLFSLRDIPAGQELTFSYSGHTALSLEDVGDSTGKQSNSEKKLCHCGSENCMGYLPFDPCLF